MCVWGQSKESNILYKQGIKLFKAEKYEEALPYFQKSDSLDKATLPPTSKNYYRAELQMANCWEGIAMAFYDDGKYAEALSPQKKVVEIRKKILGEEHPNYVVAFLNLGVFYHDNGNFTEAININKIAVELNKIIYGEEHPEYATSLNLLGEYQFEFGNYAEGIRLISNAMEIQKKVLGEKHPDYAWSLSNLACCYDEIGNSAEAIKLESIATEIRKKALGEEDPSYTAALSNLASYYYNMGNYAEAIRQETIAMEICKKVYGEEHPDYAFSLCNLAYFQDAIGNTAEAIKLGTTAMEIRKKVLGEEHPHYALSLNNLASYNYKIGNYTEAIRLSTLAMETLKKIYGEDHPNYATSLSNLAYYKSGNISESIKLENIALEIRRKALGEGHPDFAISLVKLARYNYLLGNYNEAIRLETNVKEIRKKALGEAHPDYAEALRVLAKYYFCAGNYNDAAEYYQQGYERTSAFIMKNFSWMTSNERMNYWKKFSDFYDSNLPYAAYSISNLTALAYNGLVFSKGLLLNAELEIQNLIGQSGETTLANQFYKLKSDRAMLDNLYLLSPDERYMDADSLSKVINNEERLLVESCKRIGDYTQNLSIDWKDIQTKLKDNDIAIEFANFTDTLGQNIYIALILKKGMTAPELVKLAFSNNDTIDYTTHSLYNKIWKPLDNYLQEVQNVYFSPTGKFHNIGIEYLSDDNGEIFAKKFNAYRLSSTRELALEHSVNSNKKASVYGGIIYNFDEADWQNVNNEEAERAGITFLKGAKKEAEEITQILNDANFKVDYGTEKAATEESFKKLSGSGINILHIATHGFYEPEDKENSIDDMLSAGDKISQEDRSLSRSGLYFAGANTTLDLEQRQFISEGVDDGILTAKEISRMDFKGLDLVVLSACQTGLGEVTSEGVFGLQRGFKKAGAQTIIMSLWNVSDKPTKELMTEFYRNLVAGKTKREAFILAQDKIRKKYIDPKMWAGFIMVDGIE